MFGFNSSVEIIVRFGQPETETETEEPDNERQSRTKYEYGGHRWTKSPKKKRHAKKGIHNHHQRRSSKDSQDSKSGNVKPESLFQIRMVTKIFMSDLFFSITLFAAENFLVYLLWKIGVENMQVFIVRGGGGKGLFYKIRTSLAASKTAPLKGPQKCLPPFHSSAESAHLGSTQYNIVCSRSAIHVNWISELWIASPSTAFMLQLTLSPSLHMSIWIKISSTYLTLRNAWILGTSESRVNYLILCIYVKGLFQVIL